MNRYTGKSGRDHNTGALSPWSLGVHHSPDTMCSLTQKLSKPPHFEFFMEVPLYRHD